MVDNRKKYTKKQLENLSIQELRRIDREVSTPSKPTRPKPTHLPTIPRPIRPLPSPSRDCYYTPTDCYEGVCVGNPSEQYAGIPTPYYCDGEQIHYCNTISDCPPIGEGIDEQLPTTFSEWMETFTECGPGYFDCSGGTAPDGSNCIPTAYVCDGNPDCSNSADEQISDDGIQPNGFCAPVDVEPNFHDFSQVGYEYGGTLPDPEDHPCDITMTDYDGNNDGGMISSTTVNTNITSLSNNGGGVLCLPEGAYVSWGDFTLKSNVVLRGDSGGTYIWFGNGGKIKTTSNLTSQGSFINISGLVERGSTTIHLDNTTGLSTNNEIGIYVEITDAYSESLGMVGFWSGTDAQLDECGHEDGCTRITDWHLFYKRKIMTVNGNTITIDVPVRMDIDTYNLPAKIRKLTGYQENIGIEDLFVSNAYVDYDEAWENDPGVSVIHLDGVKNSWIKSVKSFAPQMFGSGDFSGNVNNTLLPTHYPNLGTLTNLLENYIDYIPECQSDCIDVNMMNGEPWNDGSFNGGHDCLWYNNNNASQNACSVWGHQPWGNDTGANHGGMGASEACCACGGGGGCTIQNSWTYLLADILGVSTSQVATYDNVDEEQRHLTSYGIKITNSKLVTVKDCYMALPQNRGEGGNGYLYNIGSSNEILVEDSEGYRGRHNFSVSSYNSGIVFSRFYSSGGWNMSADGLNGRDVDWYSRYQKLEVMGLGVIGKCDTHQPLNHAILVTDSDILDGVSAENRGSLSAGAGHTSLDTVFWNIRGNTDHDLGDWTTMSVPGMGLVTSFSARQGYVIDPGQGLNIFTDIDNALEIADWTSEEMSGLLPTSNVDIGDNSLTLASSIIGQFATSAFQNIDDEIAHITGLEEGTCNGEWLGIPWESPTFNPGTISLNLNLDDWFADPTLPLIGAVQLNNPDMSLRLGIYSESTLCTALPCVTGGSGESNWTGDGCCQMGTCYNCCYNQTNCNIWDPCGGIGQVTFQDCTYHENPVLPDGWQSLDPYLEIWGEFSTITIDFEVTGMESDSPSVTTNISTTGDNLGYEPDGSWPTWCELFDTYFNIFDWASGNLLSGMIVDILLSDHIKPKIDEKILELLNIEGNPLTKLHQLHTFTGEENAEPDDIVTTSADVGYSGVNNLYEYQRGCIAGNPNAGGMCDNYPSPYYTASCQGNCGTNECGSNNTGYWTSNDDPTLASCWCDDLCVGYNDCCGDYCEYCG